MTPHPDPITEVDLAAYVDGQLAGPRRLAVETFLADHPLEAARVMAELRINTELRLAMPLPEGGAGLRVSHAARRLQASRLRRRLAPRLGRVAALGLLVAAGWAAHGQLGHLGVRESVASVQPPPFVEDALRAHRTSQLRAGMSSQPETSRFDPAEILSATAIRLPTLPDGWTVSDVQVFPSTHGSSVEMTLRTEGRATLSLYAARPGTFDVVEARLGAGGEADTAYWQIGEVAYALVSTGTDRTDLGQWAGRLSRTLY
ncbi:anti-sigma factor [Aureimonas flava]|uniref:Anti-sigma factor n=1 Tax=Aureimonas flava TaxID=2320271 RepID=A0A3A1WQ45_9HYPH|nr:anti-sigma factor [Aureimonas flava]RIY03213.1 anti-sigma factor [Aureimonas flava]